jgi:hypothetical protein
MKCYADLLIKPTTAQLRLYTVRNVSAAIIRSSSGRMFFLDKATYDKIVLINIYIYNNCRMLKAYAKIVVGIYKKRLESIKFCLQTSCHQNVGRTQIYLRCVHHKCHNVNKSGFVQKASRAHSPVPRIYRVIGKPVHLPKQLEVNLYIQWT